MTEQLSLRTANRYGGWARYRPPAGLAIDLGSARTRAWIPNHGLIVDAPTISVSRAGISYPVHRGSVTDVVGAAQMLHRLLSDHTSLEIPVALIVLTVPVLCEQSDREAAITAVEILRPRTTLTIDSVKAAAIGANADLAAPLLVIDIGAHLTEVAVLSDGSVLRASRMSVGTSDVSGTVTTDDLVESIVDLITGLLRHDCAPQVVDALERGPLLTGGGALRPAITYRLARRLSSPVQPAPAPQTAAIRGASAAVLAAGRHPGTR
jgi:rod shape-determining protein MreB